MQYLEPTFQHKIVQMDRRDCSTKYKYGKQTVYNKIPDTQGTIGTIVEGIHRDCQPPPHG